MDDLDIAQQWRELQETYSLMSEDELSAVAEDAYDLTPVAQEALQAVIRGRGLYIKLKTEASSSLLPPSPGHSDDSDLEDYVWVANMDEAKQLKAILNEGGVPCFFGPENVIELEDFKGSFDRGVKVKIRVVDRNRARLVHMRATDAASAGDAPDQEDEKVYAILCPKCRSEEVVFEESEPGKTDLPADSLLTWRCDSCGYEWRDEGIAKPV